MQEKLILILLFFTYSFIGWIFEVVQPLVTEHKFVNRGFLVGPILPIYGFGGIAIMIFLSKYRDDLLVLFFMSGIVCCLLEYFTSYVMEKIFNNRWWDYTNFKFNLNGRVCLLGFIAFGTLAVLSVHYMNPFFIKYYSMIDNTLLMIIDLVLFSVTLVDIAVSFNIIITLKNVSSTIKTDSTEVITKKVKQILLGKNALYKRLFDAFPTMKIYNRITILKEKLRIDKKLFKEEKDKTKKRKLFK